MMANTSHEQTLRVAADWWVRLRDPAATERTTEQWLAWTDEDAEHLVAFERVTELAARLQALGEVSRERLVAEFAPAQSPPRRWWVPASVAAALVLAVGGYAGWRAMQDADTTQTYASAIADLIHYRMIHERTVQRIAEQPLHSNTSLRARASTGSSALPTR